MEEELLTRLTSKDDAAACAFAGQIIGESESSDRWYGSFETFASLLGHPKSFVRNRALYILAALARWDTEDRFDAVLPDYLTHITDEKPITARQCVKALAQVGTAKPRLVPEILTALRNADLSKYRDSMRPLIEKDIAETVQTLEGLRPEPEKPAKETGLELKLLPQTFSVCQVTDYSRVDWDAGDCFLGKTGEENSLVCPSVVVPSNTVRRDDGWRGFRIQGVLDFSLIGILARIASVLAEEKIPIFAVSTFNTDYIFVKEDVFPKAVGKLGRSGYRIVK